MSHPPSAFFEISKIIGVSSGEGSSCNYQVQWKPTWLSSQYLVGCRHLIDEFVNNTISKNKTSTSDCSCGSESKSVTLNKDCDENTEECSSNSSSRSSSSSGSTENRNVSQDCNVTPKVKPQFINNTTVDIAMHKEDIVIHEDIVCHNALAEKNFIGIDIDIGIHPAVDSNDSVSCDKEKITSSELMISSVLERDNNNYIERQDTVADMFSKNIIDDTILKEQDPLINPVNEASESAVNLVEVKLEETEANNNNESEYGCRNGKQEHLSWSQFLEKPNVNTQHCNLNTQHCNLNTQHCNPPIGIHKIFECQFCNEKVLGSEGFIKHLDSHKQPSFELGCVEFGDSKTINKTQGTYATINKAQETYRTININKTKEIYNKRSLIEVMKAPKRILTQSTERAFMCSFCDKRFLKHFDVVRHTRIHTGERPFQCKTCEKRFKIKHHLRTHMKTHMGKDETVLNRAELDITLMNK